LNPQMMFSGVTEWISNHRDVDRRLEERDRTRKYREEIFSASVLHGRNYFADERAQTASMQQHSNRFSLSDENFGSSNYVLGDHHSPGSDHHHHYYHHADTARVTKYERPWDPHPPSTAPAQTSRHARHHPPVQTSRLTETAFGTAPRFKGDAPLVPLNEFNKQQRRQSSSTSAARATSSSSKRRRQHFRDGPATVQSIQMHQSKIAGAAARGGAGGGGSNTNSAAGDSPIPSRPGTSSQQNNNNVSKWYERDPFAPPSGGAGAGASVASQSSARRGRSSTANRLLPEIHRQKTGRTMIVQPDFVF